MKNTGEKAPAAFVWRPARSEYDYHGSRPAVAAVPRLILEKKAYIIKVIYRFVQAVWPLK